LPEEELEEILDGVSDSGRPMTLWKNLMFQMFGRQPRRSNGLIKNLDDAAEAIRKAKNILVLTGAGISVSCGIPDFRSPGGLYDQINAKYKLPDPQCLFDINYIKRDQRPFFDFALQLYPSDDYKPSPSHKFIRMLEQRNKLLRNYTQNIDTMEDKVGLQRIVQCHGSFRTARCVKCGYQTEGAAIRNDIVEKRIPLCPRCPRPDNVTEIRLEPPSPPPASTAEETAATITADAATAATASADAVATTTTTTTTADSTSATATIATVATVAETAAAATAIGVTTNVDAGETQEKGDNREKEHDDEEDDDDDEDDGGHGGGFSLADLLAGSLPNSDESDDEAYEPVDVHAPPDPSTYPPFMKPDIVFFGEPLPEDFRRRIRPDCLRCDLLIVMGSSLRVQPVALVPRIISDLNPSCPQILINRETVGFPDEFDFSILDDCDRAVDALVEKLGWRFEEPPVAAGDRDGAAEFIGANKDENTDLEEYEPVSSDNDGIPAGYTSNSSDENDADEDEEEDDVNEAVVDAPAPETVADPSQTEATAVVGTSN
jgi:NAD-dependent SIR2 family protein deacetylase